MNKWISHSKAECPHCRTKLVEANLIRAHSVQELSDFIVAKELSAQQNKHGRDFCSTHPQEALSIYCETCGVCICYTCGIWGEEHRRDQGHNLIPLEDFYKQQRKAFTVELSKLKERMRNILTLVEQVEMTMEGVKSQRAKAQQEIDIAVGDIFGRLDDQLTVKLQKLTECRRYLKRQAYEISTISTELEGKINGSKSLLVTQRDELNKRLSRAIEGLDKNHKSELEVRPDVGDIVNEIVPAYHSFSFEIENFSELQKKGDEVYSNPLVFCGLSWRLKVYPNGTSDFVGRYLAVFVELCDGYNQTATYHYRVELIHGAGKYKQTNGNIRNPRNFKRDYSSEFAVGEAWGYKKFYDLNKLNTEGFLVKDTLFLKFSIRHPTYHQKCRDYGLYVNDLKHKIMALKDRNAQLQQGITKKIDDSPQLPIILEPSESTPVVKSQKDVLEKPATVEEVSVVVNTSSSSQTEHLVGSLGSHSKPLGRSFVALSQPHHLYGSRDRMHRMEKETSRVGYHPLPMLPSSSNSRLRPKSQNLGHRYESPHHSRRNPDDIRHGHTVREQRRQSFDPGLMRMDQRMLFEQQQHLIRSQMLPGQGLSQAEYHSRDHLHVGLYPIDGVDTSPWMKPPPTKTRHPQSLPHTIGGFQESNSQSYSPTDDIHFNIEDNGSSLSTLVDTSNNQLGSHGYHSQQQLQFSQELINEPYEHSDILSPNNLTFNENTMSQKGGYFGLEIQEYPHYREPVPLWRPYKNDKRMSMNDLTLLNCGSVTSLSDMAFLSHSVHQLQEEPQNWRTNDPRKVTTARNKSLHLSHGNLQSIAGENQHNIYGPPGLKSSILPQLAAPIDHRSNTFSRKPPTHAVNDQVKRSPPKAKHPTTSSGSLTCLLYTSPSPRDRTRSRMPSSA